MFSELFRRLWSSSIVAALLAVIAMPAAAERHIQLILDASGSMYNQLPDGRYRLTAAKQALDGFVERLPLEGLHVGLRVYGSRLPANDSASCQDSHLAVPMQGFDPAELRSAIDKTRARGKTPIAYSLDQALNDLPADSEGCMVVLVTDGEEVCGGDLEATSRRLEAHGCNVDLRIIGFALDDEAAGRFSKLGRFENAKSARQLAAALERVAAEMPTPIAGVASIDVPASIPAGEPLTVHFEGDNAPGDLITIVPAGAADGTVGIWTYTEAGNPSELWAPAEPGAYEVRYRSERSRRAAARQPIEVTPSKAAIEAPTRTDAGRPLLVKWRGPDAPGDFLALVDRRSAGPPWVSWVYTSSGSPARLHTSIDPGEFEIRYYREKQEMPLARRPIEVEAVRVVLDAPPVVSAGRQLEVEWSGPDGDRDFLTIVPAGSAEDTVANWVYTGDGSPAVIMAPAEIGNYEIRYKSDREPGVFARLPISVEPGS